MRRHPLERQGVSEHAGPPAAVHDAAGQGADQHSPRCGLLQSAHPQGGEAGLACLLQQGRNKGLFVNYPLKPRSCCDEVSEWTISRS